MFTQLNDSVVLTDPWEIEQVIITQRNKFIVPVTQPLILISEVQRSGGTLLTQLLDGHKQLHVHPSELHIGRPNKYHWPELDLSLSSDQLFDQLWEHPALLHARDGYSKSGIKKNEPLPFIFLATLQRKIFNQLLNNGTASNQREVLDAYITAYFNAWLDYRGMYRDPESIKYWVSFVARVSFLPRNIDIFFENYPTGLFVSVVRDPVSWFASASKYMPNEYQDVNKSCDLWIESTESAIREFKKHAESVLILSFEELVSSPLRTLNRLCKFACMTPFLELPSPTFNGIPVKKNSSFDDRENGIDGDPRDRSKHVDATTKKTIHDRCYQLYMQAKEIISIQSEKFDTTGM